MEQATALVAGYSKEITAIFGSLSAFSFLTMGGIGALTGIAGKFGKQHITALLLATYISFFMYSFFPYKDAVIGAGDQALYRGGGLFAVLILISYFMLRNVVAGSWDMGMVEWVKAGLLSLATTALILVCMFALLPMPETSIISPYFTTWLTNPNLFFWWLILPLPIVYFSSK